MLTKEEKKKLKLMLPRGSHKIIAEIVGVSTQAVSSYFSGRSKSERIEDATLDFYRIYKENKDSKTRGIL